MPKPLTGWYLVCPVCEKSFYIRPSEAKQGWTVCSWSCRQRRGSRSGAIAEKKKDEIAKAQWRMPKKAPPAGSDEARFDFGPLVAALQPEEVKIAGRRLKTRLIVRMDIEPPIPAEWHYKKWLHRL